MAGSPWVWEDSTRRYRDTRTGRFLSNDQMVDLRDAFNDAAKARTAELAAQLAERQISLQTWEQLMQQHVKETFSAEYLLGRGGRNAATFQDWGRVGHMLRDQYGYLRGFAEEVAAGNLTAAQIAARAGLYVDSATQAYERGRAAAHGLTLPAYPADGSTQCRARCKCSWDIDERPDEWRATWRTGSKESCPTCQGRAGDWSPLVVPKEPAAAPALTMADVRRMTAGEVNANWPAVRGVLGS